MALPAVKHLDPVVGVDVHAVIVAPEPAPIYLPHPHVGFVLDLREYIDAALGVIGSIVFTFVEEEAIDYLQDNPDVANELDHALKSAATDLQQADAELMRNPLIAGGVKFSKAAGSVAGDIASSAGDIANAAGAGVGMGSVAGRPIFINGFLRATAGTHCFTCRACTSRWASHSPRPLPNYRRMTLNPIWAAGRYWLTTIRCRSWHYRR